MPGRFFLPLPVVLLGIAAVAMYLPAVHALTLRQHVVARAFFYPGTLLLFLTLFLSIATHGMRPRNPARSQLRALVLAYLMLPPVLAFPFSVAVPDTSFLNAWFEMVSSFTTTGATLYTTPGRLPDSVHLWRGLVGWAGGFLVLVAAAAILAPQNLGGFEIFAPRQVGRTRIEPGQIGPARTGDHRLRNHAAMLLPAYAGATGALWLGLILAGDPSLVALMHAMAVLSTSGISPLQGGLPASAAGGVGEVLLAAGMALALSRRLLPGTGRHEAAGPVWKDPELRVGLTLVVAVSGALFARHWLGALVTPLDDGIANGLRALWGAGFTVLSFLTTTGFESRGWTDARVWSGLEAPGLVLIGLAIMGGGVATTAGGVKLLRVYALYKLGRREMERLSDPSSVGGGGAAARQIRGDGAFVAFVFFMLFALSLGTLNLILAALGLPFERALVLSVSALTTTGPLAEVTQISERGWTGLSDLAKAVLAAAMVLGRLETLALLAFILPAAWRR